MRTKETSEHALCPLYPFDCNTETIELINGIRIERASDKFKEFLFEHCLEADSFWNESSRIEKVWVASLPFPDKTFDTIMSEKQDALTSFINILPFRTEALAFRFVTALRLYKEGLVTPGPIVIPTFGEKEPMWFTPPWLEIRSDEYTFKEPRVFSLQIEDVPAINSLFQNVYNWQAKSHLQDVYSWQTKHPENIQIALTRFHSSYGGEPEERIIDQMIAFEAICLEGEQELQYRLALRVACLIGEDAETKINIFNDMRHAYKLRSKIVHGDSGVDQKELERILPRTEEYLRKTLRKFLSLLSQHEFKQIRKQLLDQNILDSNMHL